MVIGVGREDLLAELAATSVDLDPAAQQRAEAAIIAVDWTAAVGVTASTAAGRRALLRGTGFGYEQHGQAIVAAIVRDHREPLPERAIRPGTTVREQVDAARRFLVEQFGRIRGQPMEHMFAAVDEAAVADRPLTLSERNFLDHELLEANHVATGLSQRDAHELVHQTIPPGANFSPHVLVEFSDYFGPDNFMYWGLTKHRPESC